MKNILKVLGKFLIGTIFIILQYIWYIYLIRNMSHSACFLWILSLIIAFSLIAFITPQNITPETKLYWAILILLFPLLGSLLYIITHSSITYFKLEKEIKIQEERFHRYQQDNSKIIQELKSTNPIIYSQVNYFHNVNFSIYNNCDIKYYSYGKNAFQDMLVSLKQAKQFIFLEYFIIRDSKIWEKILHILKEKAMNGVEVRILYDDIGSVFRLKNDDVSMLKKYHIQMLSFSPKNLPWEPATDNRNHRKTLVVDGEVAFTGGINIADECLERTSKYGVWKDSSIRVRGSAVFEFTKMFLVMWNANIASYPKLDMTLDKDYEHYKGKTKIYSTSGIMIPYGHNPLNKKDIASNVYLNIINQATRYLYIDTPYLILDHTMKTALQLASKRGVEIKIITPGIPDKKLVYQVTRSHYKDLLASGIQIYEYTPGFLHAKCILCDDEIATVGAVNLDYRSLYTHFENGCYFYQGTIIDKMKNDFKETLVESREILLPDLSKNFFKTIWEALLNLFAPLL